MNDSLKSLTPGFKAPRQKQTSLRCGGRGATALETFCERCLASPTSECCLYSYPQPVKSPEPAGSGAKNQH